MSQVFNRIFRNQLAGAISSATPETKNAVVTRKVREFETGSVSQSERVSSLQKALCPEELFPTSAMNWGNGPALMLCLCLSFLLIFQNHNLT